MKKSQIDEESLTLIQQQLEAAREKLETAT